MEEKLAKYKGWEKLNLNKIVLDYEKQNKVILVLNVVTIIVKRYREQGAEEN